MFCCVFQVQWKTPTLAILHVGCFGVDSARRADVMKDLRQQIWSAGGLVPSTAQQPEEANDEKLKGGFVGAWGGREEGIIDRDMSGDNNSNNIIRRESRTGRRRGSSGGASGVVEITAGKVTTGAAAVIVAFERPSNSRGSGSVGAQGGGGGGGRPRVDSRRPSVSAALTLKEGLLHKVNAGLSGLETNIFFQLMWPRKRTEQTTAVAAGVPAGSASVTWNGLEGPLYPTFSGEDPKGRLAVTSECFSGMIDSKHVASYLRRRRWLWHFDGSAAAAAAGGDSGSGSGTGGAYVWTKYLRRMILALTRSRRADGFVLVERRDNEALMVKGIRIMLGVIPDEENESGGGGGRATDVSAGATNSSRSRSWRGGGGGYEKKDAAGKGSAAAAAEEAEVKVEEGGGGGDKLRGVGSEGDRQPSNKKVAGKGKEGLRGEPRAMRILLQYRVFVVGWFIPEEYAAVSLLHGFVKRVDYLPSMTIRIGYPFIMCRREFRKSCVFYRIAGAYSSGGSFVSIVHGTRASLEYRKDCNSAPSSFFFSLVS